MSGIDELCNLLGTHHAQSTESGLQDAPDVQDSTSDGLLSFSQTLEYIDDPVYQDWQLVPMFKQSATGAMLIWQIGFDTNQLVILHGHVDGEKQLKHRSVVENNSGRTIGQQAWLEAKNRYKKMYNKGYRPLQDTSPLSHDNPGPMLANAYSEKKAGKGPKVVSAKLDGVRCLANVRKEDPNQPIALRSRENHPWKWLEHIRLELERFFFYLPEGAHIDGELYSTEMTFNELISAVRTTNTKHPRNKDVKYFIFDIILPGNMEAPFEYRYNLLVRALTRYVEESQTNSEFCILPCYPVQNHEEIMQYHDYFVQQGFEGAIVRKLAGQDPTPKILKESMYRSCRCSNILKVKQFKDEEGTIVQIIDGEGTEEGLAMFIIQDDRGNQFPIRPRGSFDVRRQWYQTPQQCIGKRYTYRYFELTEYGVPRFPVGITFRDYES